MQDTALGLNRDLFFDASIGQLFLFDMFNDTPRKLLHHYFALFIIAGVRQERGDERGATGCQWTPSGPDVQGRDMPMPHIFLVHRVQRRLFQRKINFNQALALGLLLICRIHAIYPLPLRRK